ncbi:MAG: hypothetical protein ACYTG7_17005 [Planctomycetota bacterium]
MSVILATWIFSPCPAQEGDVPQPADEQQPMREALDRTVAVVMGKAISHSEVVKSGEVLRKQNPKADEAAVYWHARKFLAQRLLLLETAKLYGGDITSEEVIRFYTYTTELEEKELEENIKEFHDQYLITTYLRCRMGLSERLQGVSPDYADFIRVTPQELKSAYRHYKTTMSMEPIIEVAQFLFPMAAFPNPVELDEAAKQCASQLKGHPADRPKLEELANQWPGCIFLAKEAASLQESIAAFAARSEVGEVSNPIVLEKGKVVAFVLKRQEPEVLSFTVYQQKFTDQHREQKMQLVQQFIIDELIQQADYYPDDLFVQKALRQPPGAGP